MRLGKRVRALEGRRSGMAVVFADGCLDAGERLTVAESYRREHGLPPDALVVVLDEADRAVL